MASTADMVIEKRKSRWTSRNLVMSMISPITAPYLKQVKYKATAPFGASARFYNTIYFVRSPLS
jgi:hypothetical protein